MNRNILLIGGLLIGAWLLSPAFRMMFSASGNNNVRSPFIAFPGTESTLNINPPKNQRPVKITPIFPVPESVQ